MSESWFDVREGTLLTGRNADAARLDETEPNAIVRVSDLLKAKDFPFSPGDYERKPEAREKEDCIVFGRWVLEQLSDVADPTKPKARITREYIERLHILGIGPSRTTIKTHFGPMWAYGEAIGALSGRSGGKYRSWALGDYVEYASKLEKSLGRKPKESDYETQSTNSDGPSLAMIASVGGTRRLNEHIGYPNVHDWSDDEYETWGARVMEANNGITLTARLISVLSKAERGPSVSTIFQHFDSLAAFQDAAANERNRLKSEQELQNEALLNEYERLHEQSLLVLPETTDISKKLTITSKYLVAAECLPYAEAPIHANIARRPMHRFVRSLQNENKSLATWDIETKAISSGTFDYLWPMEQWRTYLHIPVEMLGYTRAGQKTRATTPSRP